MAAPNLLDIYSPLGEKFEVTQPNFRDLTRHAGWTAHPPHPDTVEQNRRRLNGEIDAENDAALDEADAAAEAERAAAEEEAREAENARLREEAARTAAEDAADAEDAGDETPPPSDERVLKLLPSDFADMDKPAVFTYIEKTFPGAAIDGRTGRDNLVAKAIELANAEINA